MIALRQALHIFRKDLRHLKYESAFFLAITVLFASNSLEWVQILKLVAGCYLIARLIHGETIPGDNQFWVTRPYRWESLLGAKLLYVVVVVIAPAGLAQLYLLLSSGFPLSTLWVGWFWSVLLLLLCMALPVAALASVTAGIIPMMLSVLVLVALAFAGMPLLVMRGFQSPSLGPVEWVRDLLCFLILIIAVFTELYLQYRRRLTVRSRLLAIAGLFLLSATYLYTPWTFAFAVQSLLSRQSFDASRLQITIASHPPEVSTPTMQVPKIPLRLLLQVEGFPVGSIGQVEAAVMIFEAPDGRTWTAPPLGIAVPGASAPESRMDVFPVSIPMDASFFSAEKQQPITLHAALYFTLLGNKKELTIPFGPRVNVMDGLQCYRSGPLEREMTCRSAFRWPARKVFAQFQRGELNSFTELISYSPFPGSLGLSALEAHRASAYSREKLDAKPVVTIVSFEPLTYFRRDVEFRVGRLETLVER